MIVNDSHRRLFVAFLSLVSKLLTAFVLLSALITFPQQSFAAERVGVAFYRYDDNFIATVRRAMLREVGNYKDINLLPNDSQNNQATQNEQVDILLSRGVKVLAINLVDIAAAATVINKARPKNIPIVFFNRDPGEAVLSSYEHAYFVGTAPEESGRIQGDLIAKHWKINPSWDLNKDGVIQFALLKGEPGHPDAEARTKYVIEELNNKGYKTDQLLLDTAFWDTALAKDKMDAWLSGPNRDKIEVIIANNDAMAFGAIEALRSAGKKIPVFGVDALPEALSLLQNDSLQGTVLNDADSQAKAVLAIVDNLVNNRKAFDNSEFKVENNNTIRVPYVGVDKSNLSDFIK